jgi:hypothetical protein
MHSKKINHSFPSFTHVVELDLYFENPEMIEGEKEAELLVNPLIKTRMDAFLGNSRRLSVNAEP